MLILLIVEFVKLILQELFNTIAGNGSYGYSGDGGAATTAALHGPYSIAVDNNGNVFIADQVNGRIRKINTSGIISTVAGNGTLGYSGDGSNATNAQMNGPIGVAVDTFGNIFIADCGNHVIREINLAGIITTIAGNGTGGFAGDGGAALSANLLNPTGVNLDYYGNVFIADHGNNRIRKVNCSR